MRPSTVSVSLATLLLLMLAPVTLADEPTIGRVIVHADHVMPGESARLTGADLDAGPVVMRLEQAAGTAVVGEGVAAADGTLEATVAVPADFPAGYATLAVESEAEGDTWSTIVLIGPRAEGPGGQTETSSAPFDERAVALGVMAIGGVIFVVAMARYLRRERGTPPETL